MRYTLFAVLLMLFTTVSSKGQFKKAEIKVHGLTCSLCSRSVEMALQKVDFVDEINTDLESTITKVTFKNDLEIVPEDLAKAVRKAGFSVGYVKLAYAVNELNGKCIEGKDEAMTLIEPQAALSAGTYELVMVERDMMDNKLYKEYKDSLPEPCESAKRHYYVALADKLLLN